MHISGLAMRLARLSGAGRRLPEWLLRVAVERGASHYQLLAGRGLAPSAGLISSAPRRPLGRLPPPRPPGLEDVRLARASGGAGGVFGPLRVADGLARPLPILFLDGEVPDPARLIAQGSSQLVSNSRRLPIFANRLESESSGACSCAPACCVPAEPLARLMFSGTNQARCQEDRRAGGTGLRRSKVKA
jgi:hypothetical protein